MKSSRPYVMKARAEASAATRERILAAARDLLVMHSFDDMTIEAIAARGETTVRTVLRIFASKEELFAEALHSLGELGHAAIIPGDIAAMVSSTYDFYEKVGDTVIRWLADEPRLPAMQAHLNLGRRHLRAWIAEAFAPELKRREPEARKRLHDALIVAFDVYTWKLVRRDFGLGRKAAQPVVESIVRALIRED